MLRLTKKADYSLIALRHLAARQSESGSAVSAKEVADCYGIPLPLLAKILQKLGKAGLVASEQGTNGGYRLARDPALISALEVVRIIDGPVILTECFTDHAHCDHVARCSVKRPLQRIHEGILRLLNNLTIQDMLHDSDTDAVGGASPLIALESGRDSSVYGALRK
ncbi:MAG TPA: SUF system Fe-S cluster assembly regulator [Bryobacteraceae bacterium]|jgi:Rrf2 family protein|nr:SUF system Fe-S cluster assembly regulator [Bryobacteraceae bacterium]